MQDRRQFTRHPIYVAVSISSEDNTDRAGISRDISAGGLLFHSSTRFAVGEYVEVRFRIARADDARATGQVVRASRDPDAETVFRNITAVAFAFPVAPELRAALSFT